jgi:hypothetical protein
MRRPVPTSSISVGGHRPSRATSLSEEIVFDPPALAGDDDVQDDEMVDDRRRADDDDELLRTEDEAEADDDEGLYEGPIDVELVDELAPWAQKGNKGRGKGNPSSSSSAVDRPLGGQVLQAEDGRLLA